MVRGRAGRGGPVAGWVAVDAYSTRELSEATWGDFERLFSGGNGWDFCGCMYFHRGAHLSRADHPTRVEAGVRNREEKRALVAAGRAHGILVYAAAEPVGWCQFGPPAELPGVETGRRYGPAYRRATAGDGHAGEGPEVAWRITCFVVDKRHRGRGAARAALRGALDAIGRRGGGLVEAFPLVDGRPSAAHGGYLPLFEQQGFAVVAPFGAAAVLVRRTV